jgi:hypothetical protein
MTMVHECSRLVTDFPPEPKDRDHREEVLPTARWSSYTQVDIETANPVQNRLSKRHVGAGAITSDT